MAIIAILPISSHFQFHSGHFLTDILPRQRDFDQGCLRMFADDYCCAMVRKRADAPSRQGSFCGPQPASICEVAGSEQGETEAIPAAPDMIEWVYNSS